MMRWTSTPESIEQGEPSILAIVETILAVVAYWTIAWIWDTHIHLLTSIIVAPLLLLQSPESTDKGVKLFGDFFEEKTEITYREKPIIAFGIVLISVCISYVWASVISQYLLSDQTQTGRFLTYSYAFIFLSTLIIAMPCIKLIFGFDIFIIIIILMSALSVIMIYMSELTVYCGSSEIAGALIMIAYMVGLLFNWIAKKIMGDALRLMFETVLKFIVVAIYIPIIVIPIVIIILFYPLVSQALAIMLHPLIGFNNLVVNWRKFIWSIDSWHPPELVPEVGNRIQELSPQYYLKRIKSKFFFEKSFSILIYSILFFPAIFYR
jgi:hypothetical protein